MNPIEQLFLIYYTLFTSIAGVIALLVLVYSGLLRLTSAGNPEQLKKSKQWFWGGLLGLLILALIYPILYNINPDLTEIEIPDLVDIEQTPLDIPAVTRVTPQVLGKVEELANNIRTGSKTIEKLTEDIMSSILQCNCVFSKSLCWCNGGQASNVCEPHQCFAGKDYHPCRDYDDIKKWMENIIAWKDELLYYRNWAAAEIKDLQYEIGEVPDDPDEEGIIPIKIRNYQELMSKEPDQRFVSYYREQIGLLQQEMALKKALIESLKLIANNPDRNKDDDPDADLIKKIAPYIEKLPPLLDICVEDDLGVYGLDKTCEAECLPSPAIDPNKGACHDTILGCQGAPYCVPKENLGNPCPLDQVGEREGFTQLSMAIIPLTLGIESTANSILSIIDQIRALKSYTVSI